MHNMKKLLLPRNLIRISTLGIGYFVLNLSYLAYKMEILVGTNIGANDKHKNKSNALSCSEEEFKAIVQGMGMEYGMCGMNRRPWYNRCPITQITGCPNSEWIDDHYHRTTSVKEERREEKKKFIAINVGCNKGYDAINFLRIGTNDPSVSRDAWRNAMPESASEAVCAQDVGALDYKVPPNADVNEDATVYCIEPVPSTYTALQEAAERTGYSQNLKVLQYAVSENHEMTHVLFPNFEAGQEKQEIRSCAGKSKEKQDELKCSPVKMSSLDLIMENEHFFEEHDDSDLVDLMLIDVEGWDIRVIQGGRKILERTKYVEFEYNWKGDWMKLSKSKMNPLQEAITILEELHFTCYWPGQGELWRISSGCWNTKVYDGIPFWSNVACVNIKHAPELSEQMEELYKKTISNTTTRWMPPKASDPNKVNKRKAKNYKIG